MSLVEKICKHNKLVDFLNKSEFKLLNDIIFSEKINEGGVVEPSYIDVLRNHWVDDERFYCITALFLLYSGVVLSVNDFIRFVFEACHNIDQKRMLYLVILNLLDEDKDFLSDDLRTAISRSVNREFKYCLDRVRFHRYEKKDELKSVVFLTGFIVDKPDNSHLTLLKNAAYALKHLDPNLNCYLALSGERTVVSPIGSSWIGRRTDVFNKVWGAFVQENAVYESLNVHTSKDKIKNLLSWIEEVEPDVIIMHGNVTEAKFTGYILNKYGYPIIYYPSSVRNVPSIDVRSILVRSDDMFYRLENYYNGKQFKPHFHRMNVPATSSSDLECSFEVSHRDSHDFVISVVIGRNLISKYFLSLSNDEIESFCSLFEMERSVKAIFVGDSEFEKVFVNHPDLERQFNKGNIELLHNIPSSEIDGFFDDVNLVFSLPGVTGGAGAIAKAINRGCVAITSNDSDAAINCNEQMRYNDFEGLISKIKDLVSDKKLYESYGKINKGLRQRASGPENYKDFYEYVKEIHSQELTVSRNFR